MEYAVEGVFPNNDQDSDDDDVDDNIIDNKVATPYATVSAWLDLQQARDICAEGAKATEMHLSKSHETWRVLIDLEQRVLERMLANTNADETMPEEKNAQIECIRQLFLKRLAVPHANLAATFSDYSPFETRFDPHNYTEHMKAASAIKSKAETEYNKYDRFEMKMSETGQAMDCILDYIAFEKRKKAGAVNKLLIRTLFERAVATHCLEPTLWESFIVFLVCYLFIHFS